MWLHACSYKVSFLVVGNLCKKKLCDFGKPQEPEAYSDKRYRDKRYTYVKPFKYVTSVGERWEKRSKQVSADANSLDI